MPDSRPTRTYSEQLLSRNHELQIVKSLLCGYYSVDICVSFIFLAFLFDHLHASPQDSSGKLKAFLSRVRQWCENRCSAVASVELMLART